MPGEEKPATGAAPQSGATVPADREIVYVDANVESIAARFGGKDNAIKKLFGDARKDRDARRKAESERDAALEAAKPKAGEFLLKGDDAKAWDGYQKLGKKPEEITGILTEHKTLSERVKGVERRETHTKAAKAAQYPNAEALHELAETKGLTIVLRTEKVNDKDTDVPYVQPAEANAAPIRLTEYVDKNLAVFKPALLAPSASGTGDVARGDGSPRRTAAPDQGTGRSVVTPTDRPPTLLREKPVLPSQRGKET